MLDPFKDGQGILKSCDDRRHDGSDVLLRHFGDRVRRLFYSNKFYFINKLECAILGERLPTTMGKRCQIPRDPTDKAIFTIYVYHQSAVLGRTAKRPQRKKSAQQSRPFVRQGFIARLLGMIHTTIAHGKSMADCASGGFPLLATVKASLVFPSIHYRRAEKHW
jgi:hypothetical protein